jgi:hypothetical protein
MYNPSSRIEVQDLIFAVQTRKQVIMRQRNEAEKKNAAYLITELNNELARLNVIQQRLEQHEADLDYKDDVRNQFEDICTD